MLVVAKQRPFASLTHASQHESRLAHFIHAISLRLSQLRGKINGVYTTYKSSDFNLIKSQRSFARDISFSLSLISIIHTSISMLWCALNSPLRRAQQGSFVYIGSNYGMDTVGLIAKIAWPACRSDACTAVGRYLARPSLTKTPAFRNGRRRWRI